MQRPWFREDRWTWFVEIGGKQTPLGKHPSEIAPKKGKRGWSVPDEIEQKWLALIRATETGVEIVVAGQDRGPTIRELIQAFLDASEGQMEESSREWYGNTLKGFGDSYPSVLAADITDDMVKKWLSARKRHPRTGHEYFWGHSTRRHAIGNLKRVLNWAVDEKKIAANPIARMKRPKAISRERVLGQQERADIKELFPEGDCFRDLLTAYEESGCRPGEAAKVHARHVNLKDGVWKFKGKDFNKTGKWRVVYLTPTLLDLTRRLIAEHPTGPIFRNSRGEKWTRKAINNRLVRKKLRGLIDKDVVAYTYRTTWATDALVNEVPVATVSQLMGHADTTMVTRNYSKLAQKTEYLRDAALRAVSGRATTGPKSPPSGDGEPGQPPDSARES